MGALESLCAGVNAPQRGMIDRSVEEFVPRRRKSGSQAADFCES
jgi:hypothetical protein